MCCSLTASRRKREPRLVPHHHEPQVRRPMRFMGNPCHVEENIGSPLGLGRRTFCGVWNGLSEHPVTRTRPVCDCRTAKTADRGGGVFGGFWLDRQSVMAVPGPGRVWVRSCPSFFASLLRRSANPRPIRGSIDRSIREVGRWTATPTSTGLWGYPRGRRVGRGEGGLRRTAGNHR